MREDTGREASVEGRRRGSLSAPGSGAQPHVWSFVHEHVLHSSVVSGRAFPTRTSLM